MIVDTHKMRYDLMMILFFSFLTLGPANGFSTPTASSCISYQSSSFTGSCDKLLRNVAYFRKNRGSLHMYLPSDTPTSQTPEMVAKKMRTVSFGTRSIGLPYGPKVMNHIPRDSVYNRKRELRLDLHQLNKWKRTPGSSLSSLSVVANSDTLPSFRAAHGLLHPHTVMKLQEKYDNGELKNDAVTYFLNTYEEFGPMACLPCLTDPQVLPKLTEAMRRID